MIWKEESRKEESDKEDPIDRIHKAHSLVLRAADRWHAGSIAAVEESLAALEESAVQLHALQATVKNPVNSLTGIGNLTVVRNEILRMKGEVAKMARLSNLAARFLGGSQEPCDDSPLYGAGGITEMNSALGLRTIIQA